MRRTLLIALVVGCGPAVVLPGDESSGGATSEGDTSTSVGTSTTSPGSTTVPPPGTTASPTSGEESSSSSGGESSSITCGFLGCSETDGLPPFECSTWDQDCPEGEKCMPWANDGGNAWNATRCSPVVPDPNAPGEPCMVEGSGVSGIDDCDATSMCFNVDPETNQGTCHAFCTGSETNPMCAGECEVCPISGDGVLAICIPTCDPFAADCPAGSACYLAYDDSFLCVPDASGESGAPGDTCEFVNACDGGTMCLDAGWLPECEGNNCCSPFCTVGDPTPCAVLPGTECVPVYEDGQGPECSPPDVGVCAVPQ